MLVLSSYANLFTYQKQFLFFSYFLHVWRCIYSFIKYLLYISYVLNTVLNTEDIEVKKPDMILVLMELKSDWKTKQNREWEKNKELFSMIMPRNLIYLCIEKFVCTFQITSLRQSFRNQIPASKIMNRYKVRLVSSKV